MPFTRRLSLRLSVIALAAALSACASGPDPHDNLNATLWMQQSVEYKATAEAVYALAAKRLDEALADKGWTAVPDVQSAGYEDLPPAIILDADETVIDNSAYQAGLILNGAAYADPTWEAWAHDKSAGAVPGALAFTSAAAAKGVTVFYVTNRADAIEEPTRENLINLGFPMKDGVDTVMTKTDTSKKGVRRAAVAKDYRVLLLLGDNFGDFVDDYRGSPENRAAIYEANAGHWGRDWLMLPNPSYGSWESSAFGGDYSLPAEDQRQRKLDQLNGWSAPDADDE